MSKGIHITYNCDRLHPQCGSMVSLVSAALVQIPLMVALVLVVWNECWRWFKSHWWMPVLFAFEYEGGAVFFFSFCHGRGCGIM